MARTSHLSCAALGRPAARRYLERYSGTRYGRKVLYQVVRSELALSYRQDSATVVTVAEGQVAVFVGRPSWQRSEKGVQLGVTLLPPGYQVRLDAGAGSAQPVQVNLQQALAWLQHKIKFGSRGPPRESVS